MAATTRTGEEVGVVIREEPQCSKCGRRRADGETGWVHRPESLPDGFTIRDHWFCPEHAKGKFPFSNK
jgi:hypothetical protein